MDVWNRLERDLNLNLMSLNWLASWLRKIPDRDMTWMGARELKLQFQLQLQLKLKLGWVKGCCTSVSYQCYLITVVTIINELELLQRYSSTTRNTGVGGKVG